MRWHAGAAAVLLLALVVVGSSVAQPPPAKTPPGQRGGGSKKPPGHGSSASWPDGADTACARGSGARKAALASIRAHPSRTARATLLRILSSTANVERGMIDDLGAVKPPRSVRGAYARALSLFRSRRAADARLVARLRRRWNAPLLERQLAQDRSTNNRLADLWQRLGATTCAGYFASLDA